MNRSFAQIPHGTILKRALVTASRIFVFFTLLIPDLWAGRHFALVYECEDAFASVEINGVNVMASKKDPYVAGQRLVNEWILPGTNEIAVRIQPVSLTQGESSFSLTLYAVKSGNVSFIPASGDDAKKIYSFKWPESRTNAKPFGTNEIFFVDEAPPSLWAAQGEVLKLSETDKTNARATVVKLLESVEKKNKNAFLALAGFQLAEKARLRQDEGAAFKKTSEEALLKKFEAVSGRSFKFKPEEWTFQLLMGGKLLRVLEKSGKSPLDGEDSTFPIYLGKVGGQWLFVR